MKDHCSPLVYTVVFAEICVVLGAILFHEFFFKKDTLNYLWFIGYVVFILLLSVGVYKLYKKTEKKDKVYMIDIKPQVIKMVENV